ncbi:MAG: FtsK/SpoIIIE domain-containing protein, partial [Pirellulaceae bacterium]|nr:FtsK/SpoIIIE domain-containing protein [Pirellulaceae bacterium]
MIVASNSQLAVQVPLRQYVDAANDSPMALPYPLGSTNGRLHLADLAEAHVLLSGSTGSGKTRWLQGMIRTLAKTRLPERMKIILVDLKGLDLSVFIHLPHNLVEPITEVDDVRGALAWAVREMKERREIFKRVGAQSIRGLMDESRDALTMPRIVVVIDEVQILAACGDAMASLILLGQQALASGIHLVVATQRPCRKTLSPMLKANFTARVSLKLPTGTDSHVAIDRRGAETLRPRQLIATHAETQGPLVAPFVGDDDLVSDDKSSNTDVPRRLPVDAKASTPFSTHLHADALAPPASSPPCCTA